MQLIVVLFLLGNEATAKKLVPALRIEKFGNCPRPSGYYKDISELVNATVSRISRNTQAINGVFVMRNATKYPKMIVQLSRCRTNRYSELCEVLLNFRPNACKLFSDNMFYSSFYGSFHPRLDCPQKDGVYHIVNATFNAQGYFEFLKSIPSFENFYWASSVTFLNSQETENACWFFMMKLYYSRT